MRPIARLALAACAFSSPAVAQSVPASTDLPTPQELASHDIVTVAGGIGVTPDYEGSNDYRLIPAVAVRGKVHGVSFTTRGLYLYVDVVPDSAKFGFDAGPIVGARLNKRTHIKDDVVALLPKRNAAIEVGGFAGVSMHGLTNPYDTLSARLDVLHDVGNAHKSTIFSPTVEFSTPLSRSTYASANIGADFVSNRFADYYFSISPEDSLATAGALAPFDAGGGMKDWKAGLLLNQSLSGNLLHGLSAFGTAQYLRLVGDFKRSPIVSQRGSASQWLAAAGLAYTW